MLLRKVLLGVLLGTSVFGAGNCISELCQYRSFVNPTNATLKPKPFPKFAVPVPPPEKGLAQNIGKVVPTFKSGNSDFETKGKAVPISNIVVIKSPSSVVEVSLTSLNRIVCPDKLEEFAYSKEKQIKVVKSKNELFVKFLPVEIWNPQRGQPEIVYKDFPRDLFVKCGGQTFSLVLVPKKDLPPQVVYLELPYKGEKREAENFERSLPYEKLLVELIKDAYKDRIPPGYEAVIRTQPFKEFKELSLVEVKDYIGDRFKVRVFTITAKRNITLSEKLFVPYFPNAVAIAIEKPYLQKDEMTRLFVVEKKTP